MKCSMCKSDLVFYKDQRYETIGDHVFNPNGIPPVRKSYVCSNINCDAHKIDGFWGEDGAFYYDFKKDRIYNICERNERDSIPFNKKNFVKGNTSAIDSVSRKCDFESDDNTKIDFYKNLFFNFYIRISYHHFNDNRIFVKSIKFQQVKKLDDRFHYSDSDCISFTILFDFFMWKVLFISYIKEKIELIKDYKAIMHPKFWIRNYPYSKEYDQKLKEYIKKYKFTRITDYSAYLGDIKLWIGNYPYASFTEYCIDKSIELVSPSRITIYRLYKKLMEEKKEQENIFN